METSSFEVTDLNEKSTFPMTSLDAETFDLDATLFFDFLNPTTFNSTTVISGTVQEQQKKPIVESCAVANQSSVTNNSSTSSSSNAFSLMSPMNTDEFPFFNTPSQQLKNVDGTEDEEFLTPLVSPAIPPNYLDSLRNDANFSPLTSPALGPRRNGSIGYNLEEYQTMNTYSTQSIQEGQSSEELQERLAMIELQQQQLRANMQQTPSASSSTSSSASSSLSSSPIHKSNVYGNAPFISSPTATPSVSKPKQQTLRYKIAKSSPKFNPVTHLRSSGIPPLQSNQNHTAAQQKTHTMAPATPSLLMKLGTGAHQTRNSDTPKSADHSNPTINPNNSPFVLPVASPHEYMIDTMMALPDAMLPPSDNPTSKKPTGTIKTTTTTPTPTAASTHINKRRRISYPRSAFTPPALFPSSPGSQQSYPPPSTSYTNGMGMATTPLDQGIAALISPAALRPHYTPLPPAAMFSPGIMMSPRIHGNGSGNNLGTRASSCTISSSTSSSPRALKPLISPSLQPDGSQRGGHYTSFSIMDEQEAAAILASKSNYQALREGQAKSLGIDFTTNIQSAMENRRSAHKAAEQRRRDTLKQSFDALRMELLESILVEDALQQQDDDEDGEKVATTAITNAQENQATPLTSTTAATTTRLDREKKVKQMSKVVLLQHSYEYLLRLKSENQRKDAKLEQMTMEIQQLRSQLGMEPITEQEREAEAEEKLLQKKMRLARLKRLEDMVDT